MSKTAQKTIDVLIFEAIKEYVSATMDRHIYMTQAEIKPTELKVVQKRLKQSEEVLHRRILELTWIALTK